MEEQQTHLSWLQFFICSFSSAFLSPPLIFILSWEKSLGSEYFECNDSLTRIDIVITTLLWSWSASLTYWIGKKMSRDTVWKEGGWRTIIQSVEANCYLISESQSSSKHYSLQKKKKTRLSIWSAWKIAILFLISSAFALGLDGKSRSYGWMP